MKTAGWFLLLTVMLSSLDPRGTLAGGPVANYTNDDLPSSFFRRAPASINDLKRMQRHIEDLIATVSPAVVAVLVDSGAGSGVVVSEDGLVLCAAHVCEKANQPVRFTFPNGRRVHGKTLGLNYAMDCGLMKITDPGHWPYVEMASKQPARPGDWVLALGHPGGYDPDRSIVARLGRVFRTGDLLQTDCTLIGGDSGGPLFDMEGRVVGIHSRISESTTENFHVPIGLFAANWTRLVEGDAWGDIRPRAPSTIGVRTVDGPDSCRINSISEDGPAAKAGLLEGDLILRVGDEPVADAECFAHCVRQANPGDRITLLISRGGVEMPVDVLVTQRGGRPWRRGFGPQP
jgi:serine protease Do